MPARQPCPCTPAKNGSRLPTQCAAEFLGTFILVQTICLSVNSFMGPPAIPIGLVLAALVYQMGHISGAHFNPAVSLGVWIAGGQDLMTTLLYFLAQFAGAIVSGVVAAHTAKVSPAISATDDMGENMRAVMLKFPSISVEMGDHNGIWTEFLFTFLLVSTVLNVAVTNAPAYKDNSFFGIAIGFALMAGIAAGGAFSGGAFNPAVVCGLNTGHILFAKIQSDHDMGMGPLGNFGSPEAKSWIIVIASNFIGGAAAGFWFLWTDKGEGEKEEAAHFAGDLSKPLKGKSTSNY